MFPSLPSRGPTLSWTFCLLHTYAYKLLLSCFMLKANLFFIAFLSISNFSCSLVKDLTKDWLVRVTRTYMTHVRYYVRFCDSRTIFMVSSESLVRVSRMCVTLQNASALRCNVDRRLKHGYTMSLTERWPMCAFDPVRFQIINYLHTRDQLLSNGSVKLSTNWRHTCGAFEQFCRKFCWNSVS